MAHRSVQLYLYADLPGIGWRYCRAVFGAKITLSPTSCCDLTGPRNSRPRLITTSAIGATAIRCSAQTASTVDHDVLALAQQLPEPRARIDPQVFKVFVRNAPVTDWEVVGAT